MARQTNININVNSTSAVKSIETLKTAFIELNTAVEKTVGKEKKIKLEIDLGNTDLNTVKALSKGLGQLNKRFSEYSTNLDTLAKHGQMFTVTTNNITNNIRKTSEASQSLNRDLLASIAVFETFRRAYSNVFNSYTELTNATFGVGIAGQMNISQINQLNDSFLKLSTTVPVTARELTVAVDDLIRTGRSYEQSREIIEQVAKLSVASGDSLKDTAQVVTKVMVALNVDSSKTIETLNTMHSTAIQTASDMGYLAEAFKNVAGTASVLVTSAGLNGKELDDYKQDVLDLTMAMIGSMANLGLSASQAGTKVKNMFSKLTAMEKTAKNLFNEAMKINNVKINDELFNADKLSQMARENLPKAVQLMSKLYTEGKLSTQVMQKMFTGRHFMEISDTLTKIGGDVDNFTNSIARGVNYTSDYYKNLFNINNQLIQFTNNIKAISQNMGSGDGITGLLMMANEGLPKIQNATNGIVKGVTSIGTSFTLATMSAGFFITKIAPLFKLGALFNPISITIGAIATALLSIGKVNYNLNRDIADLNISLDSNSLKIKRIENNIFNVKNYLKTIKNSVDAIPQLEILDPQYNSILENITSGLKEFKVTMESVREISPIDSDNVTANIKEIEDNLNKTVTEYNKIQNNYKQQLDSIVSKIAIKRSGVGSNLEYSQAKSIIYQYLKLQSTISDTEERMKKLDEYIKTTQKGSDVSSAKYLIRDLDKNEDLKKHFKDVEESEKKFNDIQSETQQKLNESQNSITKYQETLNRLDAGIADVESKIFEKTGKILIDSKEFSGLEGFEQLFKKTVLKDVDIQLDVLQSTITELNQAYDEGLKNGLSEIQLNDIKNDIKDKNKELEKQTKIKEQINLEDLKNYQYNKVTKDIFYQILSLRTEMAYLPDPTGINKATFERLQKWEKDSIQLLDIAEKERVEKETKTKYQIKYVNYLKESVSLELEGLKIGKTKGEQELLIYNYKLKQLELDRKIAQEEVNVAKDTLATTPMDANLRNQINNITDVNSGQKFIDDFYKKYKTVLMTTGGEQGKSLKNIYEAVKVYVSALSKTKKIDTEIDLTPLKEMNEILLNIPKTMQTSFNSLQEMAEKGLIPFNSYGQKMIDNMVYDFEQNKSKVIEAYSLGSMEISEAINENLSNIRFAESLKGNNIGVSDFINNLRKRFENNPIMLDQLIVTGDVDKDLATVLKFLKSEQEDLNKIAKDGVDIEKEKISLYKKELDILSSIGGIISEFGNILDNETLSKLGSAFNSTQKFEEAMSDIHINWDEIFNGNNLSENLSQAFKGALEGVNLGSSIGSMVGNITGGGKSSQAGGSLAGLVTGAMGMTGWGAIATTVGGSLIGGLFDKGKDDQAEAEKRTKESNKIYNKNTEALQKLAQNMANLSGGIDGLNNTLINAVSKIPTIDNISNVTDAMTNMYKTMEKTRKFNDVAYQVTKTKKGKSGFLGIGAKAGSTWTETITLSVDEMLKRYGFKGAIEDMTSQQIRDFATWLDNYDLGDTDNFSVLADALEDYAEGLDKFEKNIQNFFRDSTMEAFVGISSLEQEGLRQQIEDFYKNLGFQIDDEISKQIDKIAEEMSVMVTIMQDVRGEFLNQWRTTGQEAGSVFVKSMSPYIDAILNNISQIYYDVYFSGVNESLEKEFKNLSEQLVELKKQGNDLDWSSVTGALSDSFDKVLNTIIATKDETASFNDILMELQKQALESGLSLSEIFDLGLMSGTQKDVMESFKNALTSSENDNALTSIGELLGDKIGQVMANKMIDNMLSDRILEFSAQIDKVMSGNLGFDSLAELANRGLEVGLMMQQESERLNAIKSLFDFNSDIEYTTQNENITLDSGVSQSVTNIYNLSSSVEAGNVIESDSIERLADSLLDTILEKLKVDKGIDLQNR